MMTSISKVLNGTIALVAALSQSQTNGTSLWFGTLLLSLSHDHEASISNSAPWQLQVLSSTNVDLGVSRLGTLQAPRLQDFLPDTVRSCWTRLIFSSVIAAVPTWSRYSCYLDSSDVYRILWFALLTRSIVLFSTFGRSSRVSSIQVLLVRNIYLCSSQHYQI